MQITPARSYRCTPPPPHKRECPVTEASLQHGLDWEGEDLTGYVLTEKFDGCRAYWDGQHLWSRSGKQAKLPAEWAAALPAMALDCELYDGVGGVYRCGAALRYGRFTESMRLVAFDAPQANGNYVLRMQAAATALSNCRVAHAASMTVCQGTEHTLQLLHAIQARGGEGLMARNPALAYTPGRTRGLLKVKHAAAGWAA